jgi:hypothetical protein
MSTGTRERCGTRYPVKVMRFAQRMDEEGKTNAEIRAGLARLGYWPSRDTVVRWVDPEHAEYTRVRQRRGRRPHISRRRAWRYRLDRLRALRELELSYTALAKLMNFDFGLELTEHQVRSILREWVGERTVQRCLTPEGVRRA